MNRSQRITSFENFVSDNELIDEQIISNIFNFCPLEMLDPNTLADISPAEIADLVSDFSSELDEDAPNKMQVRALIAGAKSFISKMKEKVEPSPSSGTDAIAQALMGALGLDPVKDSLRKNVLATLNKLKEIKDNAELINIASQYLQNQGVVAYLFNRKTDQLDPDMTYGLFSTLGASSATAHNLVRQGEFKVGDTVYEVRSFDRIFDKDEFVWFSPSGEKIIIMENLKQATTGQNDYSPILFAEESLSWKKNKMATLLYGFQTGNLVALTNSHMNRIIQTICNPEKNTDEWAASEAFNLLKEEDKEKLISQIYKKITASTVSQSLKDSSEILLVGSYYDRNDSYEKTYTCQGSVDWTNQWPRDYNEVLCSAFNSIESLRHFALETGIGAGNFPYLGSVKSTAHELINIFGRMGLMRNSLEVFLRNQAVAAFHSQVRRLLNTLG